MIFESLWPLFLLAAVPIIIILYLLKPKGEDYRISSNLLWQKILKNQQSKTFFEKFIHNILMYVQILIVLLLVLALMSPFIHMMGKSGGRKVFRQGKDPQRNERPDYKASGRVEGKTAAGAYKS